MDQFEPQITIVEQIRLLINTELERIFSEDREYNNDIIKSQIRHIIREEIVRFLDPDNVENVIERTNMQQHISNIITVDILGNHTVLSHSIKESIRNEFDILLQDKEMRNKIIGKIQKIQNRSEILDLEE